MWSAAATQRMILIFFVLGGLVPSKMASFTSAINCSFIVFTVSVASWSRV